MGHTVESSNRQAERPNSITKWILPSHGKSNYPIQLPSKRRDWMDVNNGHAYRCLPLVVANGFGWEILNPITFEATWNGSLGHGGDTIKFTFFPENDDDRKFIETKLVASHFGNGIITFSGLNFIIRTSKNQNVFLKGPTNHFKHGAHALEAIIESDWLPYTFTLNWKLTAPDLLVKFTKGEPLACLFPFPRNYLESFEAKEEVGDPSSELNREHLSWVQRRQAFEGKPHLAYVKGLENVRDGTPGIVQDHQRSIRGCPFSSKATKMTPDSTQFSAKTFDDTFSAEECGKIVEFAKLTEAWEPVPDNIWDKRTIHYHNLPEEIRAFVGPRYKGIQALFKKEYGFDAWIYPDTIALVRWMPGMDQSPHADDMSDSAKEHPRFAHRLLGSVMYLNEDFSGGETYYPKHNFKVKPKRGTLAVHRGDMNHQHGVTKIDGGIRYTIASFWTLDRARAVPGIDWA